MNCVTALKIPVATRSEIVPVVAPIVEEVVLIFVFGTALYSNKSATQMIAMPPRESRKFPARLSPIAIIAIVFVTML